MRWATATHNKIWSRLISVISQTTPNPNVIAPLLDHPTLSCLPPFARRNAAAVVLKNQFVKISNLQLAWHEGLQEVFTLTKHQTGDEDLIQTWTGQLQHIRTLHNQGMSMIPGDLDMLIVEEHVEQLLEEQEVSTVDERAQEQDVVLIEEDESDGSSSDGEDNNDVLPGLFNALDLVEINSAVDPETLFM
ncbi:hypothetical protein DFH28DRAFT_904239 [Melampsora americana]|nr:hypothetical protein DFH28DRAFT_904239 [Melampsora americana]